MPRRWIVRPLAEADLERAVSWYEAQKDGLGLRFLVAADDLFGRLRESPLQFPSVSAESAVHFCRPFRTPSTSVQRTTGLLCWQCCISVAIRGRGALDPESRQHLHGGPIT